MTGDVTAARSDIAQVLYRYCRGMDRMDADLTRDCFLPDARLDYSSLFTGSPQDFIDWLWPIHAAMVDHMHELSNISVEVDGERAASEAYVQTTLRCQDRDEVFDLIGNGRYLDSWVRGAGRWRIARRTYVGDLSTTRPVVKRELGHLLPPQRTTPPVRGSRDPADPSYRILDTAGS